MKRMQLRQWQDPAATLLGAWFAVSPSVLGIQANSARGVCVALGLALMLTGISAMLKAKGRECWVVGPTGFVAFLSPWIFGLRASRWRAATPWSRVLPPLCLPREC